MAVGSAIYNFGLRKELLHLRHHDSIFTNDHHNWMKCESESTLEEMIRREQEIHDGVLLYRWRGWQFSGTNNYDTLLPIWQSFAEGQPAPTGMRRSTHQSGGSLLDWF